MTDTEEIRTVRSGETRTCPVCHKMPSSPHSTDTLEIGVNHLLNAHGWKLLHVGQETITAHDGEKYEETVAVLGRPSG